jgi:hypothetical protein
LREEAERALAALRDAEVAWERFVITRETMSEVLSAPGSPVPPAVANCADGQPAAASAPEREAVAAAAGSVVPMWRAGLATSALSADCQQLLNALADCEQDDEGGALTCRAIAEAAGLELVAAKVEGVRSKANRLAARGWLFKDAAGRFRRADGLRGGGS